MESKTNAPSFTVSLRGYDRMEVDEYLDSLAEALGQVEEAEERSRGLQSHIDRLNARIADLEERIRTDVPKTGAILAERISIMLRSAEETAADTINRAEATSAELLEKAHEEVASAEDQARGAIARSEEQGRRIESAARAEAAEIIAEAEGRASTRTRQIEQWAEQVISHTRAEEARMLTEQQEKKDHAEAQLRSLIEQRDAVAASIAQLRESLGQALGLVSTRKSAALDAANGEAVRAIPISTSASGADRDEDPSGEGDGDGDEGGSHAVHDGPALAAETDGEDPAESVDEDEMPWPAAFSPVNDVAADAADDAGGDEDTDDGDGDGRDGDGTGPAVAGEDRTGEIELRDLAPEDGPASDASEDEDGESSGEESDEFDTKFDAWVSGSLGPRHFRRL